MKKTTRARPGAGKKAPAKRPARVIAGAAGDPVVLRFAAEGLTPVTAFLALRGRAAGACLLESAAEHDVTARVSLLALEPEFRLVSDSGRSRVEGLHGPPLLPGESPFAWLRRVLATRKSSAPGIPA